MCTSPSHDHLTLGDALIHPSLDDQALLAALSALQTVCSRGTGIRLGNLPDSSRIAALRGPQTGSLIRTQTDTDPERRQSGRWRWLETRRSAWFELQSEPSIPPGKLRRNLKRLRKRLSDRGDIKVRFIQQTEQRSTALERFFTLEGSGWKGDSGTAIREDDRLLAFYRALCTDQMVIGELWCADSLLASEIGVLDDSGLNLLKIAYDEAHASYSPGSLLLEDTLAFARTRQLQRLGLVTSPVWADRWHPSSEPVWQVTRYHDTMGGALQQQLDVTRSMLKQVRDRSRGASHGASRGAPGGAFGEASD